MTKKNPIFPTLLLLSQCLPPAANPYAQHHFRRRKEEEFRKKNQILPIRAYGAGK
jgi:hypothetical protein